MRGVVRLAGLLLVAGWPAATMVQAAPAASTRTSADARLKALYDGYAAWDAKESGNFQDLRGETKPADYLPRVDAATQQRRAAHLQDLLKQLNAIPVAQLSPPEKVNAAVFRTLLERSEERRVGKECRSRWSPYH